MTQKTLEQDMQNAESVENLVGFNAVSKLGKTLRDEEIIAIAEYAKIRRADKAYVIGILKQKGRPFSLEDPAFQQQCRICRELRNYCCC